VLAHTEAHIVPSNQVYGFNGDGDAEMVGFAQTLCVDPAHEVSAGLEYVCALDANVVDVLLGHRRQCGTSTLTRAFIAEFQMVEDAAVLWIKEHQRCAAIRQGSQQHDRIPTLC
jgi:hypothetical protein